MHICDHPFGMQGTVLSLRKSAGRKFTTHLQDLQSVFGLQHVTMKGKNERVSQECSQRRCCNPREEGGERTQGQGEVLMQGQRSGEETSLAGEQGAMGLKSNSRHRVDMSEREVKWIGQALQSPHKAPGAAGF